MTKKKIGKTWLIIFKQNSLIGQLSLAQKRTSILLVNESWLTFFDLQWPKNILTIQKPKNILNHHFQFSNQNNNWGSVCWPSFSGSSDTKILTVPNVHEHKKTAGPGSIPWWVRPKDFISWYSQLPASLAFSI